MSHQIINRPYEPLFYVCPTCKAAPGARCTSPKRDGSSFITETHEERSVLATQYVRGIQADHFTFRDEEIISALGETSGYMRETIAHTLSRLTSGEKFSLYRAIVKLADQKREALKG